jgi:general secretion pathway protein D
MPALLLAACAETPHSDIDTLVPPHAQLPASSQPVESQTLPRPQSQAPAAAGSGIVAGHSAFGGREGAVALPAGDDVTLDFADADIAAVARSVLVDILHLSVAIDPRVNGKVTLQTSGPVKREAVLPLLEDAFRMNGAAIVTGHDEIAVVPADAAKFSQGTARYGTARGPGWRTQIVPLHYADAVNVQKNLEAMAPIGSTIHADAASNTLLLTGSSTEIANLLDTISAFDSDALSGKSFALWPLQVADVRTMVADLEGVYGRVQPGEATPSIRFLPILRLNAVLAVARDAEMLRQAHQWVDKLDQADGVAESQLFVYRVASGRASHLAEVLAKLYPDDVVETVGSEHSNQSGQDKSHFSSSSTSSTTTTTSSSATTGTPGTAATDPAKPNAGSAAAAPAGVAMAPLPTDTNQQSHTSGTRIVADAVNNTLLIHTRPAVYRRIEADLRKLDVMPSQVSIEATILEVTLTDQLSLGTQFFLHSGKSGFKLAPDSSGFIAPIAPGFSYVWSSTSPQLVVDALKGVTDVNVVSAPTMMVIDNETAKLQVGDQVPVITSTSESTVTSGAPVINTVEYHDTGIILSVTPRISGGVVTMELQQEVSQVTQTTSSSIDSPTFQQRRFYSSVTVGDGETLMMGGLISNQRTRSNQGIPYLADVPVLGVLFGQRADSTNRTELMVMITPHIVRNPVEAAAASDEIRRRIRETVTPKVGVLP